MFRSGEFAGQSSTPTPCSFNQLLVLLAVWAGAKSCWKMNYFIYLWIIYGYLVGVYLPLLWEQSFCWKSPIALGYTRGHFSALVAMENDGYDNRGAGANLNTDDDVTVTFLPLVDSERKLLHIHFLSAQEVRTALLTSKHSRAWICLRPACTTTEFAVWIYIYIYIHKWNVFLFKTSQVNKVKHLPNRYFSPVDYIKTIVLHYKFSKMLSLNMQMMH